MVVRWADMIGNTKAGAIRCMGSELIRWGPIKWGPIM